MIKLFNLFLSGNECLWDAEGEIKFSMLITVSLLCRGSQ